MGQRRRRLLLTYPYFGPYHLARWRALTESSGDRRWEVVPVEILARQDRYDWGSDAAPGGIVRLGLESDGRDQIRWRDALRFLRSIRALQPDAIAVNGWALRDSILLHLWCWLRGVRRIVVTDSTEREAPRSPLKERVKRLLLRGAGAAFVAGAASGRYVASLGIPESHVVTGCDVVDNSHFAAARTLRRPNPDAPARLLTVARFVPAKNLLAAAEAFLAAVGPVGSDATWTLAGYGPLEAELRAVAEASDGRIRVIGAVTYDDLPTVLAAADVLWLPSLSEPWGLVVNEAMAAGLPVAVSDRAGCHEDLVNAATGWTLDPSTVSSLSAGLRTVLADRRRWGVMGEAAAAHIAQWDLDRFSTGLLAAAEIAGADR